MELKACFLVCKETRGSGENPRVHGENFALKYLTNRTACGLGKPWGSLRPVVLKWFSSKLFLFFTSNLLPTSPKTRSILIYQNNKRIKVGNYCLRRSRRGVCLGFLLGPVVRPVPQQREKLGETCLELFGLKPPKSSREIRYPKHH